MARQARDFFADFDMPPEIINEYPANLSNEQRQLVAIAHALCRPCKLLLLDDTLAALSFQRQQKLLNLVRELVAQNVSVVISSDDLKHIFAVTNRILVLYQGRQAALRSTEKTTPREIVEMIVGSNRQDQITPVIWAFENYYAAQQQAEELRRAQQVLRQSLKEQDSLNRLLIERLRKQVEALDHLNLALQEANRRLMTEREAERKALARELHDQVIQDLLSYTYQLEDAENEAADEAIRQELANIRNGIRQVVSGLRQLCSDLRPPTIDSHGLSAAIRSLTHQWSKQSGIRVELDVDPGLGRLPEPIELSVFRIIQEGLNNIRKHANNASLVKLSLQRTPTASLVVHLTDNGQGLERPLDLAELSERKHFGLVGISERVSLLRGTMQVESPESGGLELLVEIPSPYPSVVV
jgi:signal transduction histidine kinase